MVRPDYLFDIDDFPPPAYAVIYALQWAVIVFPALAIAASLASRALHFSSVEEVRFLQFTLVTTGVFTAVQTIWGHRYPLIEGPSTAVLLTFTLLAPYGYGAICGGTMAGAAFLAALAASRRLDKALAFFTPNVVGVILMLIAFTLLPHLAGPLAGIEPGGSSRGAPEVFLVSLFLMLFITAFAHWSRGIWKTLALFLGMVVGTAVFAVMERVDATPFLESTWMAFPVPWIARPPEFPWPSMVAFAFTYAAVAVNSLGSIQGIANITDAHRLPAGIRRGLLVNGISGFCCGLLGVVGTVSYSTGPGVVLVNRVASRYVVTCCGALLLAAAFLPKIASFLALVPAAVVGAALTTAMAGQVGAGFAIVLKQGHFTGRDTFVVGLPLMVGTLIGFLPPAFFEALPGLLRAFLGNGLVTGIVLVICLEHAVLKPRTEEPGRKP